MKRMRGVLFLCTGNSCRSQMAEGFARLYAPPGTEVLSAGTKPVGLNPRAVAAMREAGVDISGQRSKSLNEIDLTRVDRVVTLCGDACAARKGDEHWDVEDPARGEGTEAEIARRFREARDEIRRRVAGMFGVVDLQSAPRNPNTQLPTPSSKLPT